jgi:hypothetical protein
MSARLPSLLEHLVKQAIYIVISKHQPLVPAVVDQEHCKEMAGSGKDVVQARGIRLYSLSRYSGRGNC